MHERHDPLLRRRRIGQAVEDGLGFANVGLAIHRESPKRNRRHPHVGVPRHEMPVDPVEHTFVVTQRQGSRRVWQRGVEECRSAVGVAVLESVVERRSAPLRKHPPSVTARWSELPSTVLTVP